MKLRCPVCHSGNSIEAYAADEAGRDLLLLLAGSGPLFRPLAHYLGCFRSGGRDLAHDRALRLGREVLELGADPRALAAALVETVEALRLKREAGDVRPLKNHNYLKRVLEGMPALAPALQSSGQSALTSPATPTARARSKTLIADQVLADWAGEHWLRIEVAHGLRALLALPLYKAPEADAVDRTASLWERELSRCGVEIEQVDRERVQKGFSGLISAAKGKFPEPGELLPYLPRRCERDKLPAPPPNAEEIERGRQFMRDAVNRFGGGS